MRYVLLLLVLLPMGCIVEAPGGAHFTACEPDYGRDEPFQREYAAAATDPSAC